MSDLMILGVLRMPVTPDSDYLTLKQYIDRGRQAADLIEQQQARIAELEILIATECVRNNELAATVERLLDITNKAGVALAMLPEDALGEVPDNHERQGWFIRDELIYNLEQAVLHGYRYAERIKRGEA